MRTYIKTNEENVTALCEELNERRGYLYDSDFSVLYGLGWTITGVEISNPEAAAAATSFFFNRAVAFSLEVK